MPKLQQLHQYLKVQKDPSIDRAYAAALPTAEPASLPVLAEVLLQRRHTPGGVALIQQYHRLPDATQQAILRAAPELTRALRTALGHTASHGPKNALHIIRQSASVRLAYLVPDLLRHGNDPLKDDAALCLLEMANRAMHEDGTAVSDPVEIGFVVSAVREAVRFLAQHQRRNVLLAMFALPLTEVTGLLAGLPPMGENFTHPVGVTLTRSDTPAVRRALLPALAVGPLHAFAQDGIGLAVETGRIAEALHHWPLLQLKRIRSAVKRLKQTDRFLPEPTAYTQPVEPGQTAGLPAWVTALPMEHHATARRLSVFNQASDPMTRLVALRRLLQLAHGVGPDAQVHHAIAGFCSDDRPELVRIALTHLIRVHYPDITKVLAQLINSPDPHVKRIAAKRLAPVAFPKLWDSWPRLDADARLAAGRALIKIDPNFHAALHDKLCLPDAEAKTRALSIIGELNQGLLLQELIVRCCRDSNAHVVASGVKALGSADPQRALPILERALEHEDDRVRANAVEALAQLNTGQHADRLARMTAETEHNRARANAIQALMPLSTTEALQALSRMLNDTRAQHRASALWLVESLGVAEVARDVAEMSITEPDPAVRARAGHVIQHIIDLMSQPVPISHMLEEPPASETPHAAAG